MQQHHKGEGEIIYNPAQKPLPVQLDIFQPVDGNAVYLLPDRDVGPIQVFLGIAAQNPHGEPAFLQRQHRVKGQLGGGNILRVKKLAQK